MSKIGQYVVSILRHSLVSEVGHQCLNSDTGVQNRILLFKIRHCCQILDDSAPNCTYFFVRRCVLKFGLW